MQKSAGKYSHNGCRLRLPECYDLVSIVCRTASMAQGSRSGSRQIAWEHCAGSVRSTSRRAHKTRLCTSLQFLITDHLLSAVQHPWLRSQGVAADKPLDSVVLHRMRKLSATNKLKKAALVVMARSLSPDEINGLQQLFRNIDADNSGTITIDELRTALTSCNGKMSVRNRPEPDSFPKRVCAAGTLLTMWVSRAHM